MLVNCQLGGREDEGQSGFTLALEAPVDAHFDIPFNCTAAGANRSQFASERAAQGSGDGVPVIDPIALAQNVTKGGADWHPTCKKEKGQQPLPVAALAL